MKQTFSKAKMSLLMLAIAFVVYNIVLFLIAGFSGHEGAFWVSYVFVLIAFASLVYGGYFLKTRNSAAKDWLFGFPILRHCMFYLGVEFFVSVLFMILDANGCSWKVAFLVQLVLLAVHMVFFISCIMTKVTIENVQEKVAAGTSYIRNLQIEAEMAAEIAKDAALKASLQKLAESIRYSDPISHSSVSVLEGQLIEYVGLIKEAIAFEDNERAQKLCDYATLLLLERNKKLKAAK